MSSTALAPACSMGESTAHKSQQEDSIMTQLYLAIILALGLSTAAFAQQPSPHDAPPTPIARMSLGLGVGAMYGQVGTNLEYRFTDQISATAGIGLDGEGNWFGGVRYSLKPAGEGSRAAHPGYRQH